MRTLKNRGKAALRGKSQIVRMDRQAISAFLFDGGWGAVVDDLTQLGLATHFPDQGDEPAAEAQDQRSEIVNGVSWGVGFSGNNGNKRGPVYPPPGFSWNCCAGGHLRASPGPVSAE